MLICGAKNSVQATVVSVAIFMHNCGNVCRGSWILRLTVDTAHPTFRCKAGRGHIISTDFRSTAHSLKKTVWRYLSLRAISFRHWKKYSSTTVTDTYRQLSHYRIMHAASESACHGAWQYECKRETHGTLNQQRRRDEGWRQWLWWATKELKNAGWCHFLLIIANFALKKQLRQQ